MSLRPNCGWLPLLLLATLLFMPFEAKAEKKIGVLLYSEEARYYDSLKGIREQLAKAGYKEPVVKFIIGNAGGNKAKAEQEASSYIRQAAISVNETLKLGWEFEQLGMDDYALRCYKQAIAAAPDSDAANKQIGMYYLHKNDSASAKQYLMKSFELNPRQPDVAGELGRLGVVVQTPGIPEGPLEEKKK